MPASSSEMDALDVRHTRVQLGGPSRAVPALGPYLAIVLSSFDHLYGILW